MEPITAILLVVGLALIASEALHMALVPVFLGVSLWIVAGLRAAGVLESIPLSVLVWAVTSLALALPLRPLLRRMLPHGDQHRDRSTTDNVAMGEVVEVVETTDEQGDTGRIRVQGTTWSARTTEGVLHKGSRARLVYRDGLVWIIEPLGALEAADIVPAGQHVRAHSSKEH